MIQVALEQNELSPTIFDGPVLLSHDRVEMVRLGDLDGDGDLDAVAGHGTTLNASGSSQFVTIFKNDNGRLVRELDLQVFNAGTENIALADVDGDNILDILIVTGDSANDRFRVMKGNGDLTFGFLSSFALSLDPTSLAVGDVNGDGSPDVVISRGGSNDSLLLINDGAGTFTESALPAGDRTFDVRLADVNGDGNLDAVFAGIATVRLSLGDGTGSFAPSIRLNTGSQTHDAVEVLDFNGDGRLDIISTAIFGLIQFFENDGAGGFIESSITIPVSGRLNDIAVADLNFDGFQDFVLSNNGSANSADAARVFLNDGLGRFPTQPLFVRSGAAPSSVALGDLDQDGDFELLIGNDSSNDMSVVYGKGDGSFLDNPALPGFAGTNPRPKSLEMADLDGDGNLDIVTALQTNDTIAVQLGDGAGGFGSPLEFAATAGPHDLAIGDVNADGVPDVVVTENGAGRVVLLIGRGDGAFAAPQPIDNTTAALAVEVADVDGDGHADLVLADGVKVEVFFGQSDGTFPTKVTSDTVNGVGLIEDNYMQVVDLDGDNDLDVVLGKGAFRIINNTGARQFTLESVATDVTSTTVQKAQAVDLNGDGFLDLVGLAIGQAFQPTNDRSGIVVRLSDGAGGFQTGQAFSAGGQTQDGFAIADFNLDGILDIVVSTAADNNVSLLIGDGTGAFLPAEHFNIRSGSESSLAVGDIDRDGDVDIVVPSFDNRNITLLFNHTVFACQTQVCKQTFEYDADFSQLTRSVDELGRQRLFEIDPATGNTLRETIVMGLPDAASFETDDLVTQFTYTPQGLIDTRTDPLGRVTDFDYDNFGRLISITVAVGTADEAVRRFEYDAVGNQTAEIDENDHRTEFEYDALNRVVLIRDALNGESKFAYDADGNVTSSRDELDQPTRFEYDAMNRLVKQIDAVENFSTFEYDGFGNLTRQVDRLGRATQYRYDARDRLVETIDAEGGRTSFGYDADGNVIAATDENGNTTRSFFDQRNRRTHRFDALDGLSRTLVDAAGFSVTDIDELGRRTDNFRDDADRLIEIHHPDADGDGPATRPIWQFQFDKAGNTLAETDPLGRVTQFVYDNRDRLIQRIEADPDGAGPLTSPVTSFEYDDRSLLTRSTDPLGRATTFEYDALQRQIRTTAPDPDGAGPQSSPVTTTNYNAVDNVLDVTDALGNTTRFEYDALNRRTRTTQPDPGGAGPRLSPVLTVEYDAEGQLLSITDPVARTTRLEYDNLGRMIRQIAPDPDGTGPDTSPVTRFQYDAFGNTLAVIDALGNQTNFEYDALHRLVGTVDADPDGVGPKQRPSTTQIYDAASQQIASIDPLGRRTDFTFDDLGRVIAIAQPDPDGDGPQVSSVYQTAYDLIGNVTSQTDALGRITVFDYDNLYRQTTVTAPDPDGAGPQTSPISRFAYDAAGQLLTSTDPLGRLTAFAYDDLGRLIVQTDPDPDGAGPLASPVTNFTFDAVGNNRSIVDPLGNVTRFEYDDLLRLIRTIEADPDGAGPLASPVMEFDYDIASQMIAETDPLGRTTTFEFDDLGRVVRRVAPDPDGAGPQQSPSTAFVFDLVDNLLSTTDALGQSTSFTYDNLYRRTAETDANNDTTSLEYDLVGRRTALVDPLNNRTTYEYDDLDRLIVATDPLLNTTRFAYDAVNNLTERTDRLNRVIRYTNDDLDRRVQEQWLDAGNVVRTLDYKFDNAGQLLSDSDPSAVNTYQYDALGRITTKVTNVSGFASNVTFSYQYDAVGNMLRHEAQIGTVNDFVNQYQYDNLHRKTQTAQSSSGGNAVAEKRVNFTYDVASQINALDRFADLVGTQLVAGSSYTFDLASRLTSLAHTKTGDIAKYDWTYDSANRISSFDSQQDGLATFTYDARDQLTAADYATQDDLAFSYDQNGNRAGNGNAVGANNRTTADATFDYAYDAEGNRIRRENRTTGEITEYTWDHRNRLIQVTERPSDGAAATLVATHAYDTFNRWVGSAIDSDGAGSAPAESRFYFYESNNVVLNFDGPAATDVAHRYVWGVMIDQILADEQVTDPSQPGNVLWTLGDNQNTVRDLVTYDAGSDTTTVANHKTYDAFGNVTAETDTAIDSLFGYTGRPFDNATDLQNNLNRWYDAALGKWLSEDPIGFEAGDANLYRYAGNSATLAVDPDGLLELEDLPFVENISKPSPFDAAADLARKTAKDNARNIKIVDFLMDLHKIPVSDVVIDLAENGSIKGVGITDDAFRASLALQEKIIEKGLHPGLKMSEAIAREKAARKAAEETAEATLKQAARETAEPVARKATQEVAEQAAKSGLFNKALGFIGQNAGKLASGLLSVGMQVIDYATVVMEVTAEAYIAQQRFKNKAEQDRHQEEIERKLSELFRKKNEALLAQQEQERITNNLRIENEREGDNAAQKRFNALFGLDEAEIAFRKKEIEQSKGKGRNRARQQTTGKGLSPLEQFFALAGPNDPNLRDEDIIKPLTPSAEGSGFGPQGIERRAEQRLRANRMAQQLGFSNRSNCPPNMPELGPENNV